MTSNSKRRSGSYRPSWDKGNGWRQTKPEWQDYEKAVDKTVSIAEVKDLWCPASGSTITVETEIEGLSFDLNVGPKEYNVSTNKKRKPTCFGVTFTSDGKTVYFPFIPQPTSSPEAVHGGAWHKKMSWSAAVRKLLNTIIPLYVKESETMCLRAVALRQGPKVLEVQKPGEDQTPAA